MTIKSNELFKEDGIILVLSGCQFIDGFVSLKFIEEFPRDEIDLGEMKLEVIIENDSAAPRES